MDAIDGRASAAAPTPAVDAGREAKRAERRRATSGAAGRRASARPPRPSWPSRARCAPTSPLDDPVPTPPFWGTRVVKGVAAGRLRGAARRAGHCSWASGACAASAAATGPSYEELVETEGRPRLRYWLDRLATEGCCEAAVVYGYFPAVVRGRRRWSCSTSRDPTRRSGPGSPSRASAATGACAWPTSSGPARWPSAGEVDVMPLHLVTMGQPIAEFANELFAAERLPRLPRGARPRRAAHRGAGRVLAPARSARS